MPPLREQTGDREEGSAAPLQSWVRGSLAGLALGLTTVFALACWLNPYKVDGTPRRMATHQQLGLPPCTFWRVTGLPCPSCGMSTSFALLIRGDLANAMRANSVGALLAGFGLLVLPWSVVSAIRGRTVFVRSLEQTVAWIVTGFLGLALLRWFAVVAVLFWTGKPLAL